MPNHDFLTYKAAVGALANAIEPPFVFMQPNEAASRLVMSARPFWILRDSSRCLGSVDAITGKVHQHRQKSR